MVKPDQVAFSILADLDHPLLQGTNQVHAWFSDSLVIIMPDSHPLGLPLQLDSNGEYRSYALDTLRAIDAGIEDIRTETIPLKEYFGEDDSEKINDMYAKFALHPDGVVSSMSPKGDEVVFIKEGGEIVAKRLLLIQASKERNRAFLRHEVSDGTQRLLDYIPLFRKVIDEPKVFLIDEMERSIHPVLIKALIKKFSETENTRGQIVFTTHESNLLDQSIFRQDEIWFAEKDRYGSTDFYPLSEFKQHHTKNIRLGYLEGRYGAIPFLGDLEKLN